MPFKINIKHVFNDFDKRRIEEFLQISKGKVK